MPNDPKFSPDATASLAKIFSRLETHLGLELRSRDQRRVEQGVADRMKALGLKRIGDYLPLLNTVAEFGALIRVATVGESWFFRDSGQMRLVRHLLLPQLIAARHRQHRLRIWSAGCATGQEAWSLAMLVRDALPDASGWDISILGTDINTASLAVATSGVYTNWHLRGLNEASRGQHFSPFGKDWRIDEPLRKWVRFAPDNLVAEAPPPIDDADLVLCRNVLIYLKRDYLPTVMSRLGAALRTGGVLVAGHCELLDVVSDDLEIQQFPEGLVYRRSSVSPPSGPQAVGLPHAGRHASNRRPAGGSPRPRVAIQVSACRAPDRPRPPGDSQPQDRVAEQADRAQRGATGSPTSATATSELTPDLGIAELLAAAEASAAIGDYAHAGELARQARGRDALDYRPVYLLAQLAELESDDATAVRLLAEVLYLDPHFIPAYLDSAAHLERLGATDRAMRHRHAARRLLETIPNEQALPAPYQDIQAGTLKAYLGDLLAGVDTGRDLIGSDTEARPLQVERHD